MSQCVLFRVHVFMFSLCCICVSEQINDEIMMMKIELKLWQLNLDCHMRPTEVNARLARGCAGGA